VADLLDVYLAEERLKPFVWGEGNGDCLLFLAGWAERLRWPQAGLPWRGKYSDEDGARRLLAASGGAVEAISSVVGRPSTELGFKRGDLGLVPMDDWFLGMISTGTMWAVRSGRNGIVLWRRQPAFVWALGF
jgi:hypothetical protein